jgi:penicillin amidase
LNKWFYDATWSLDESRGPRDGRTWDEILPVALSAAYRTAVDVNGADPSAWRWDTVHATNAQHLLSENFPQLASDLNPPRTPLGGDADTVQNGGYSAAVSEPFDINLLSVYRQVVDLADIAHAEWIVPGGVSALPGTPHYADQLEQWRVHERAPMTYTDADIEAGTRHRLELHPADGA